METEAPVSTQNFLSDLRTINEAMRQFDSPGVSMSAPGYAPTPNLPAMQLPPTQTLHPRTIVIIQELREKLNLGSDAEAINILASVAYKSLRSLFG